VQHYPRAAELPPAWDALAGSFFRSRAFLEHCERHNPCHQRYYGLWRKDELVAGAIAYDLTLDLLTYLGTGRRDAARAGAAPTDGGPAAAAQRRQLRSPLRMTVIGVPCSVAWPGLLGAPKHSNPLLAAVLERERGLVLGLNTAPRPTITGLVQGPTLPTVVLEHELSSFDDYLAALRSDYRRRYRRIATAMAGAQRIVGPCSKLTERGYRLYLGAFERSDAKLEKLSHGFFTALPAPFQLTRYELRGALLGWHISAVEPGRTTFFMGGVDQDLNERYRVYFNLLFDVIRQGIEAGCTTIDLGQTAEVPKLRTGAILEPRGMFAWNRWRPLRGVLQRAAPWLTYGETFEAPRVFKGKA